MRKRKCKDGEKSIIVQYCKSYLFFGCSFQSHFQSLIQPTTKCILPNGNAISLHFCSASIHYTNCHKSCIIEAATMAFIQQLAAVAITLCSLYVQQYRISDTLSDICDVYREKILDFICSMLCMVCLGSPSLFYFIEAHKNV